MAQEQVNSSSAASATIPKPVSAIITRQNGVMPSPSSSRSPSGGDTGAAGADGDGGVMGGGLVDGLCPSAYALSTELALLYEYERERVVDNRL